HLSEKIIFWLYFIPLFVFLIGTYQVISNWALRKKNYNSISYYRIVNSLTTVLSNIGLGIFIKGETGLFLGNLAGNLLSLIAFWKTIFSDILNLLNHVSSGKMKEVAIKYKHFPLTNSFLAASGMFQISGIIYFISYFFNQAVVGAFSYTIRVLQAPMNFIGGAISQVFYQQASILKNDRDKLKHLITSTIKRSSLISLPFLIVLVVWGPQLFAFVFGEKWESAGVYARILSPWIFLDFVRATVSQLVLIVEKQKTFLLFYVAGNILLVISMMIGGMLTHNILHCFILFSVLNSLLTVYILFWLYNLCNAKK
ncbi:MAG TPA: oligosaccharide flippase family protein, partial [Bacteroidia bacterium]